MELCRHARSGNFISCSSYFVPVPYCVHHRPDSGGSVYWHSVSYDLFHSNHRVGQRLGSCVYSDYGTYCYFWWNDKELGGECLGRITINSI